MATAEKRMNERERMRGGGQIKRQKKREGTDIKILKESIRKKGTKTERQIQNKEKERPEERDIQMDRLKVKRQADRKYERQIDRQTAVWADRQTNGQKCKQSADTESKMK